LSRVAPALQREPERIEPRRAVSLLGSSAYKMLIDTKRLRSGAVIESEICIIGGGVAGITLALELARARNQVSCYRESAGSPYLSTSFNSLFAYTRRLTYCSLCIKTSYFYYFPLQYRLNQIFDLACQYVCCLVSFRDFLCFY
jgi:hypothetical protein